MLQACVRYQRLEALLQGQAPAGVLPPAPRAYVLDRIQQLAKGPCMSVFVWNAGGSHLHAPWTPDLPTDSALLLYLFCAYLEVGRASSGARSRSPLTLAVHHAPRSLTRAPIGLFRIMVP